LFRLRVGIDVGCILGGFVSPFFVGSVVVGYFDGEEVGTNVGTLVVGLTVGWLVG